MTGETDVSVTAPRTIDGLRVAIAGLSPDMPVENSPDTGLTAGSVNELRALKRLPFPVEAIIPYRIGLRFPAQKGRFTALHNRPRPGTENVNW